MAHEVRARGADPALRRLLGSLGDGCRVLRISCVALGLVDGCLEHFELRALAARSEDYPQALARSAPAPS